MATTRCMNGIEIYNSIKKEENYESDTKDNTN